MDIWSLGVVILELAYDLPYQRHGSGVDWCQKIVGQVNSPRIDDLADILRHMLVMEPSMRNSAATAFQAVQTHQWLWDTITTPAQAAYHEPIDGLPWEYPQVAQAEPAAGAGDVGGIAGQQQLDLFADP